MAHRLPTIYRGRVGAPMRPPARRARRVVHREPVRLRSGPLDGHTLWLSADTGKTLIFALRGRVGCYEAGYWSPIDR